MVMSCSSLCSVMVMNCFSFLHEDFFLIKLAYTEYYLIPNSYNLSSFFNLSDPWPQIVNLQIYSFYLNSIHNIPPPIPSHLIPFHQPIIYKTQASLTNLTTILDIA